MMVDSVSERILVSDADMLRFGASLSAKLHAGLVIYLEGQLGSGKTTLVRGILRGLGYTEKVKSPTYTIVEPYEFQGRAVYHFDLYRLNQPIELQQLGISDYVTDTTICLIEWPEKGEGYLPLPDIICRIEGLKEGRKLFFKAASEKGRELLENDFPE